MQQFQIVLGAVLFLSTAAMAQEESVASLPLFAEAPTHEPQSALAPPPLVVADTDSPGAASEPPKESFTSPVQVSPPSTPSTTAASPTAPAAGVDVHATTPSTQDPLRGGRFFAQTQGALSTGTSQSLALSLTASGGYLFTPQVAAGARVVWSSTGGGSQYGGGAFATYHLSFGNARIVPAVTGGVTILSTSVANVSHLGFLVDLTGQIEAFITDSVAVVPYATVAVGNLVGDPAVQVQLGWALAVYF